MAIDTSLDEKQEPKKKPLTYLELTFIVVFGFFIALLLMFVLCYYDHKTPLQIEQQEHKDNHTSIF